MLVTDTFQAIDNSPQGIIIMTTVNNDCSHKGEDLEVVNLNLRERNKQEKWSRIQQAAWQLFQQKGYEATTTREVAELAEVGTGTLFLYVKDKEELLLAIYHKAIDDTIEQAFAALPEGTLLEELLHIFGHFFRFYNRNTGLGRVYIKALLFHQGYHERANEQINRFMARLAIRLKAAQERGEVDAQVTLAQATANLFAIYYAVLSFWLADGFEVEEALEKHLPAAFSLQIDGLRPKQ